MDLTEFVRARLDEDKAVARAASPGPWHVNAESDEVLAVDDIIVADGFALSGPQLRATTAHIARHDPVRVLAQVAAMRSIVVEYERAKADIYSSSAADTEDVLGPIIRQFAAIWSGHDDYDATWGE